MIQRMMERTVIVIIRIRHGFCHSSNKVSENSKSNQMIMDVCMVISSMQDKIKIVEYYIQLTDQFGALVKRVKQGN